MYIVMIIKSWILCTFYYMYIYNIFIIISSVASLILPHQTVNSLTTKDVLFSGPSRA